MIGDLNIGVKSELILIIGGSGDVIRFSMNIHFRLKMSLALILVTDWSKREMKLYDLCVLLSFYPLMAQYTKLTFLFNVF